MSTAFVGIIAFHYPSLAFYAVVPTATLSAAAMWVLWCNIQQEKDHNQRPHKSKDC